MVFKHFHIQCTIRTLLLAATLFLLFLLQSHQASVIYITTLAVISAGQVYTLIKYIEKTRKDLTEFLEAILYEDFSRVLRAKGEGRVQEELFDVFNKIFKKFQQAKTETETQYRYLQTVVQHIGISLISFQADGTLEIINNAAKRLFKCTNMRKVQDLSSFSPQLVEKLLTISNGHTELIKIEQEDSLLQLIIYGTEFILRDKKYKLVSLQNIQSELEEKEMEAWQNLIRVLTHEIMNSITPIASLASTAVGLMTPENRELAPEAKNDIHSALLTIEKRSQGLLKFVYSYRQLSRLPSPDFQIIHLKRLIDSLKQLMQEALTARNIILQCSIDPESLEITADSDMIEQVLINLINNAIDALSETSNPQILLRAFLNVHGRPCIQVEDNGRGILEEVQSKIFIPFFSTKKGGTGIGLSLSRQILRMHGGAIRVQSGIDKGTIFTLRF